MTDTPRLNSLGRERDGASSDVGCGHRCRCCCVTGENSVRSLHRIYARLFGYFWLPCPVCEWHFGGHEIVNVFTAALVMPDGRAMCVCPDPQCNHAAVVLNMKNGHAQALGIVPLSYR